MKTIKAQQPIAIIGIGCHVPGKGRDIESTEALFDFLLNKQSAIGGVPTSRWQQQDSLICNRGGFLEDIRLFDPHFFHIPSEQAAQMDPQQRLFLETAIHALNQSNIAPHRLSNSRTGVFCGISTNEYSQLNFKDDINFSPYTSIGTANSATAGRLSHFLNLKGPALAIDSACSSSLSAVSIAVKSLKEHESDLAIAGGVYLQIVPEVLDGLDQAQMLSPSHQCYAFNDKRNGYVRSEGVGIIVLKRLDDAINDNDNILGVIKGIHSNQDGSGTSLKAPNIKAQVSLHKGLYEQCGVSPSDIDWIETHGTGTDIGDATEAEAISTLHQYSHDEEEPLVLGALKTNLGHTISASGILGLIKVLLALKHETIPPNLHATHPDPNLNLNQIPAILPDTPLAYPASPGKKRLVQVSNFGFTGTNVSVLIEEAPTRHIISETNELGGEHTLYLSAESQGSLSQLIDNTCAELSNSPYHLRNICFSALDCRDHYRFRLAVSGQNKRQIKEKLEQGDYTVRQVNSKHLVVKASSIEELNNAFFEGYQINAASLFPHAQKVPLPLYPFDRQVTWHKQLATKTSNHHPLAIISHYEKVNFIEANERKPLRIQLPLGQTQLANLPVCEKEGLRTLITTHKNIELVIIPCLNNEGISAASKTLKAVYHVLQRLESMEEPPLITLLTERAVLVANETELKLAQTPLLGLVQTLALEKSSLPIRLLDVDSVHRLDLDKKLDQLPLVQQSTTERLVALRNNNFFTYRLKQIELNEKPVEVNSEGAYLISGGLGGLGIEATKTLLTLGAKHIHLISRRAHPKRHETIEYLATQYNASIHVHHFDIADSYPLSELLGKINQNTPVKGILHAAGVGFKHPALDARDEEIDKVFRGKVLGAYNLHHYSQSFDLDFFILYSSISSVFGANREAVYGAANTYLNQLAHYRVANGLTATAIQWPAWGESGMAVSRSQKGTAAQGLLSNQQGNTLLRIALSTTPTSVCFASSEFIHFIADFFPENLPRSHELFIQSLETPHQTPPKPISTTQPTVANALSTDEQREHVQNTLEALIRELLALDNDYLLDFDSGFFDLGFDSLMLTELASKLREAFSGQVRIPFNIAFDHPTLSQLMDHLVSELSNDLNGKNHVQAINYQNDDDEIAIIGYSCRFPNSESVADFETLLNEGAHGFQPIPLSRYDINDYYDPEIGKPSKLYIKELAMLENIDEFDPAFFTISPREAKFIDPLHRLLLEQTYLALENANIPPSLIKGKNAGVYVGVCSPEYRYVHQALNQVGLVKSSTYTATGFAPNMLAGRIGYHFDLLGPQQAVDTACSSSFVAVHQAVGALQSGEIELAIAGAANLCLLPHSTISMCSLKALSPDSRCYTFDDRANGYARGEGAAIYLLKRKSDALRDGNTIHAIIKGSSVTSDGKSAGLTVPNGSKQQLAMNIALARSGLAPEDVDYVEAHGTGTPLGDPIEVNAIQSAYCYDKARKSPLVLSSVKTNIGNLEGASGMAGLTKVVLSIKNKCFYPHLNFNTLNSKISLNDSTIPLTKTPWNNKHRVAGINSFGFSGVNTHILIGEYVDKAPTKTAKPGPYLLCVSAKSEVSLHALKDRYVHYLNNTKHTFSDIAFTSQVGRDHYPYRIAVIANSNEEAINKLQSGDYESAHIQVQRMSQSRQYNLEARQQAYIQGDKIDWQDYFHYDKAHFSLISLPNYVFDKKSYWLFKTSDHISLYPRKTNSVQKVTTHSKIDTNAFNLSDYQQLETADKSKAVIALVRKITLHCLELDEPSDLDNEMNLYDLGLDSLNASDINQQILKSLDIDDFPLLVEHLQGDPTVLSIASQIEAALADLKQLIPSGKSSAIYPLTYSQLSMWIDYYHLYLFNTSERLFIQGILNIPALKLAINDVIRLNPVLRLQFNFDYPGQQIHPHESYDVPVYRIGEKNGPIKKQLEKFFEYDLTFPLGRKDRRCFRFALYCIKSNYFALHIVLAHAISDLATNFTIRRQIKQAYEARLADSIYHPEEDPNAFFDYIPYERQHAETNIEKKLIFWKRYYSKEGDLHLPDDYLLACGKQSENIQTVYQINENTLTRIKYKFKQQGVNPSQGFMAIILLALSEFHEQEILNFLVLSAGRENKRFQHTLGSYFNSKLLCMHISKKKPLADLALAIQQELSYTAPFQSVPFELKFSNTLNWKQSILYQFVKRLTLKPLNNSWTHTAFIKAFHQLNTKNFISLLRYRLYRLFKKPFLLKPRNKKVTELFLNFNFCPTFLDKIDPGIAEYLAKFGEGRVSEPGVLENIPYNFQSNVLGFFLIRDQQGCAHVVIRGPIAATFREQLMHSIVKRFEELEEENSEESTKEAAEMA